jgi:hypothetical protein
MKNYLFALTLLGASLLPGTSHAMLFAYDVEITGWWDAEGGGALFGSLITDETADDDGLLDFGSELMDWEWAWTGNPFVTAFTITSRDPGAGIDITAGTAGFYVDGTPNLPDFADGLDQGIFIGGAVGEFLVDLEFLTIEDNTVAFPFGGDFTIGDPASQFGMVSISEPRAVPEPMPLMLLALAIPFALRNRRRAQG